MAELKISEAEWKVMEVLWDRREVRPLEIIEALENESDWNHRTIRTLLARLTKKGAVKITERRGRNRYSPAISRSECLKTEGKSFAGKFFGGDMQALLTHFVEEEPLSQKQVEALRALLDSTTKPKSNPKNRSK